MMVGCCTSLLASSTRGHLRRRNMASELGWSCGDLNPRPPLTECHGRGLFIDHQKSPLACVILVPDLSTPVTHSRHFAGVFGG
jgi:hypothetical protein